MPAVSYPFDTTGTAESNLVTGEIHRVTEINSAPYRIIIPKFAPFYLHNLALYHVSPLGVKTELTEGVEYYPVLSYVAASRSTGRPVYGGLSIITELAEGDIEIEYQTLGGIWVADRDYVYEQLLLSQYNKRMTWWDNITNVQQIFPPTDHGLPAGDIEGHTSLLAKLEEIRQALLVAPTSVPKSFAQHMLSQGNVHGLSKIDLELDEVENLPMATDMEVVTRQPLNKYVTLRQILMLLS